MAEAGGRQLDGALSRARHGSGVVRGLDLAGVLRARARGDLQARLAQCRPGRAAASQRAATSPRSSQVVNTSIIVVRGMDGEVRAFHNICRHRGNKLVWNDIPRDEVNGTCRQFTCKYHGWRYDLDGDVELRAAGRRVLRPRQGRLRPRPGALRRLGGLHLRQPRPGARAVAEGVPRADDHVGSRVTRSTR